MARSAWVQRRKRSTRYWLLFFLFLLLVIGTIVIRNNPGVLSGNQSADGRQTHIRAQGAQRASESSVAPQTATSGTPTTSVRQTSAVNEGAKEVPHGLATRNSVVIPGIGCELADRSDLSVVLSLELFFKSDSLKEEIMLKREQLKVMVRKVLARKNLDEVVVEPLRAEIQREVNALLRGGRVVDIEFRDFRIEET